MALIFRVVYPNGEQADAIGYPERILRVDGVPCGPAACAYDEVECDFTGHADGLVPVRVVRVVGGPRLPTIHVRVAGDEAERDAWMTAREAEGWWTRESDDDPTIIWVAASTAGMCPSDLERDGARIIERIAGSG